MRHADSSTRVLNDERRTRGGERQDAAWRKHSLCATSAAFTTGCTTAEAQTPENKRLARQKLLTAATLQRYSWNAGTRARTGMGRVRPRQPRPSATQVRRVCQFRHTCNPPPSHERERERFWLVSLQTKTLRMPKRQLRHTVSRPGAPSPMRVHENGLRRVIGRMYRNRKREDELRTECDHEIDPFCDAGGTQPLPPWGTPYQILIGCEHPFTQLICALSGLCIINAPQIRTDYSSAELPLASFHKRLLPTR